MSPRRSRPSADTNPYREGSPRDLAKAAGLEPLEEFPGYKRPWRCRCLAQGHEITPWFNDIRRGGGCRICNWRGPGNDVDPDFAVQEMRAAGLEPLVDYPGSDKPWPSRCQRCGSEVAPRLLKVRTRKLGCSQCVNAERSGAARQRASQLTPGSNTLVEPKTAADVMRNAGLKPLTDYPGSKTPWRCKCINCGAEVAPSFAKVKNRTVGCRYCAQRLRAKASRNNHEAAVEVMRSAGLEPLVDYPGADKPWPSSCSQCGQEVAPRYSKVRHRAVGCRHCARAGRVPFQSTAGNDLPRT